MADTQQTEQEARNPEAEAASPASEAVRIETEAPKPEAQAPKVDRPEGRPQGDRPPQGPRREGGGPQGHSREGGGQGQRREGGRPGGDRPGGDRPPSRGGPQGGREGGRGERGDDRRGGDRGRFEGPPEIDIEKLISDPLYLDNQAHGVVSRMRDMDSGTKSQLRRLYNAVRRAVRAPENERQQQFVMLRARLAYTIARHSLRSLDSLEKLLLQVTRKNDARGYERFRDLFEAIVAYNE
jgi:CRISPR type III-A-associated protein Csm2